MRIALLLHSTYHRKDSEFVREAYWQLLNRLPDEQEVAVRMHSLSNGATKSEMLEEIVSSGEATELYSQCSDDLTETAASKIQYMLSTDNETFVFLLHVEFLCRAVENDELGNLLNALGQGMPRMDIIRSVVSSEEWLLLLESDKTVLDRRMFAFFTNSR